MQAEFEFFVEASLRQITDLKDRRGNAYEDLLGHVRRLSLAFELVADLLVDAVDAEPLDVVVLVHEFDAAGDQFDDLLVFLRVCC